MAKRTRLTHEDLEEIKALMLGIAGISPYEDLTSQVGVGPGLLGVFTTSGPYVATSLRIYKNGVLLFPGVGNDYVETNPLIGEFTFEALVIPSGSDQVRVIYTPHP